MCDWIKHDIKESYKHKHTEVGHFIGSSYIASEKEKHIFFNHFVLDAI
jgi:hypothetical protein